MTTAIGIDVGSQRVGISLSDDSGSVATAHETLDASDARALMEEICDLIERRSVELIVVGWPLHMDGSEGRATEAVERFVERLRTRLADRDLSPDIETWDERLTSTEAEDVLLEADVGRRRRREVVDRIAATRILQSYLDAQ